MMFKLFAPAAYEGEPGASRPAAPEPTTGARR
jgi:hypothetical protein